VQTSDYKNCFNFGSVLIDTNATQLSQLLLQIRENIFKNSAEDHIFT